MDSEQIIQEATEAVEKGLPCAYLVPHLLDVVKNKKLEIEILIRKKEALRDEIAEQQAEIERLQKTGEEAVNCFTRMESLYKIKCKELEVAKSEAYREFAERTEKQILPLLTSATLEKKEAIYFCLDVIQNELKELTESK